MAYDCRDDEPTSRGPPSWLKDQAASPQRIRSIRLPELHHVEPASFPLARILAEVEHVSLTQLAGFIPDRNAGADLMGEP